MAQAGVIQNRKSDDLAPRDYTITRIRVITVIGIIGAWEAFATLGRMEILYGDVIPSSWMIFVAIWQELTSSNFYHHLGITFAEHIVGFTVGSLIAIALGISMGVNETLRKALEPYLNAIGSTPKIIFLPILFLVFGTGIESKMAKGALSAFFPVVFTTALGMALINPVLIKVGRSFNLSKWQMVTKVFMPAMVNPVITGLRLGMAITVIGVLVAELKFSDGGLGYQLGIYYEQFRIAPMYAIIVIIFALAAAANVGMTMLQDRVNRHMAPTTAKGKRASASGNLGVVATN
ncbi:MAG: ABC transporter permease [Rhodospirillaceae bacterium]|jgi:ABC-type nitrate/sulfonate/bicarbonate transport system permease component|nr:ABC transporter permease [Rhodospirillaceae bacterium]